MKFINDPTASIADKLRSSMSLTTSNIKKIYPAWVKDLFVFFTVTYKTLWTDTLFSEEMIEATKMLWANTLERYSPELIQKAAIICSTQYDFPPTPHQMLEVLNTESRNQRMNDDMKIRDKSRLLEEIQPRTLSRKTLEAKREMWVKLGMMNKVKGIDDELTTLDLQEK